MHKESNLTLKEVNQESTLILCKLGKCYMPSPKAIGFLVPEKIFKGFLPYMGVVAMLVM